MFFRSAVLAFPSARRSGLAYVVDQRTLQISSPHQEKTKLNDYLCARVLQMGDGFSDLIGYIPARIKSPQ
jgi:hypothetical protein